MGGAFRKFPANLVRLMHFRISPGDVRRSQVWSSSTGMAEGLLRTETEKQCLLTAAGRMLGCGQRGPGQAA